jgi:hypothetical protein
MLYLVAAVRRDLRVERLWLAADKFFEIRYVPVTLTGSGICNTNVA